MTEPSVTDPRQLRDYADQVLELHEAGELDAALEAAESLEAHAAAGDLTDEVVRESLFTARFERALLLNELGEVEQAADAYARAAATPTDPDDPDQRHEVAMALLNRGICLDEAGDAQVALAAYDEVIRRFGDADDPVTADLATRARTNRAASLLGLGYASQVIDEVATIADELADDEPLAVEQLLIGRRLRAAAEQQLGRFDEALAAVTDLPGEHLDEPAVVVQRAAAQHDRAELLVELDRADEAGALLDHLDGVVAAEPDLAELGDEVARTRARLTDGWPGGG